MSGSKMFVGDHLEVRQSGRVFLDGGGMRVGSLEDNGNPLDGMVIYPFGDVSGNGVIVGSQRIVCYGLISPGASPGTLTIDGDVTMEGSATLSIELGGIAPGEFDQLIVTGNAVVSGTVNVSFVNGFSPTVGDAFPIIQSGSQDGTFNTVVMPPGYTGECACSGSGLSIVVTSANPNIPAASAWGCIALVLLIVTAGTLVLRTKADCG